MVDANRILPDVIQGRTALKGSHPAATVILDNSLMQKDRGPAATVRVRRRIRMKQEKRRVRPVLALRFPQTQATRARRAQFRLDLTHISTQITTVNIVKAVSQDPLRLVGLLILRILKAVM